ncbi:ribonuclease H protein [Canna indica]|uniref:Ribonuclease H protein n=1 Tax=Canna indica TaxID=4628 RepID=A0AAQ3K4T2_9LILI|nr:ribonuclease H protein [Canna indica]
MEGKPKSWTVKGILAALYGLREGLKIKIGNGNSTNIWSDPWIVCMPLNRWPTFINVEMTHNVSQTAQYQFNRRNASLPIRVENSNSSQNKNQVGHSATLYTDHGASYTIFCDASWDENMGYFGYDFLTLNGEQKEILLGYGMNSTPNILSAELHAIWMILLSANTMNMKHLKIFSDCKPAIDILNNLAKPPWMVKDVVKDIRHLTLNTQVNCWCYLRREFNSNAHKLANAGLSNSDLALDDAIKWIYIDCLSNTLRNVQVRLFD